jgi:serine/threonine-protein kinase HipA
MSLPEIKYCPSTLQPGYTTYSPLAQQNLFGGRTKKVSHILPFAAPGKNNEQTRQFNEKRKRISISGVQEKYSLRLEKNVLDLTDTGGTHIIKPIPAEKLERVEDLPANEHVSMQIAKQVYQLNTAACGLIFFEDGAPAYITRRFDYKPGGAGKYQVEDFATLLAKSPESEGDDFKYNASYLDIANQIDRHVSAALVVKREFFRLVVFNYLIANGDAHLKNFSLIETPDGDYVLSPAYDLLCTSLHIDDSRMALNGGLYPDDYLEDTFSSFGTYTTASFIEFGKKIGLPERLTHIEVERIIAGAADAIEFIGHSFLSEEGKSAYTAIINERKRGLLL